jgi:archaellum biogenesis ATPase FlaH
MAAVAAMTNSDFLAEVYGPLGAGLHGWVCSFSADPSNPPPSVWAGRPYKALPAQANLIDGATDQNSYFCTAVLRATSEGEIVRRKDAFERLAVLVVDDVQPGDVDGFSYAIQTSPGKFQVGIFLDAEDADAQNKQLIDRVMAALSVRGRTNDGSGNGAVRYVRLPGGINSKPRPAGDWQVRLEQWNPSVRWSLDDACSAVGIQLDALRVAAALPAPSGGGSGVHAGEMITSLTAPVSERTYHDAIVRLAASLVSNGMFPGAAVEFLRDLMRQVKPTGPDEEVRRWQSRFDEIERAVRSAEKFAPDERKPPQITVNLGLASEPDPVASDLVAMDWRALQGVEAEPPTWRIENWLPAGTTTLLAANGGVGKSNLSLQLAVCLAFGYPCIGMVTKPSRVLVLSGEDEARTVHFRVANVCADLKVDIADLEGRVIVYDLTRSDCVLWRDGAVTDRMQWLADVVVRTRADVVIIDNASDVFADNENDRTAVRGFMRCLNLIAFETLAAMLLLAHVDKASVRHGAGSDSASTFSGSTAWNNSARSRWAMTREDDAVLLRHEKSNLGPLQGEIKLEFDPYAKVFRPFGTIPGKAAAVSLMRNQQRGAILRLIDEEAERGANLSMSMQAPTNVWAVIRDKPGCPHMPRRDFFALLNELERSALVKMEPFVRSNRTTGSRLVVTDAGRALARSERGE